MSFRHLLNSRFPIFLLICFIFFSYFPVVTRSSIELYETQDWLNAAPTVYFYCKGENKTILPDVRKPTSCTLLRGEESCQPLIHCTSKKCKRCGFYEKDIVSDDKFEDWEFCLDFTSPQGKYILT